ncbi:MAG: hypothetical protein ACNS61_01140 [Candidatus Wenzhouxiangella sp. M2_3B_020]
MKSATTTRIALVIALSSWFAAAVAEAFGPREPWPESGRWFADDGSKTGFFIEVQDGVLAGLYVGADAVGDNLWLSFSGRLQPRFPNPEYPDDQRGWQLQSDLVQFRGGGCIVDCPEPPLTPGPLIVEPLGRIDVRFSGRSRATFRVDEGDPVEIRPIYFGVAAAAPDSRQPDAVLPDLEGPWMVAKFGADSRLPDATGAIELGPRTGAFPIIPVPPPGTPTAQVEHAVTSDPDALLPEDASLFCTFYSTDPLRRCGFFYTLGPMSSMSIDFESISDARFTMIQSFDVVGDFVRYEFFRLGHD